MPRLHSGQQAWYPAVREVPRCWYPSHTRSRRHRRRLSCPRPRSDGYSSLQYRDELSLYRVDRLIEKLEMLRWSAEHRQGSQDTHV
jgi:hypothetical protein